MLIPLTILSDAMAIALIGWAIHSETTLHVAGAMAVVAVVASLLICGGERQS